MKRASPTLIGAFVVVGIALTVAAVVAIGSGRFFRDTYPFILYFPGQVDGLRVGASVRYKGVQIGSVTRILLHYQQKPTDQRIPVFIELDERTVEDAGGANDFSPDGIKAAIDRGLRAQLQTESLLTGLLFVQLDYQPNTPATFVGLSTDLQEIPTLPTALEEIQTVVRRALDRIEHLDLDKFVKSLENTIQAVDRLVSSPELKRTIESLDATLISVRHLSDELTAQVKPAAASFLETAERTRGTLSELEATLKNTRSILAPDSPLAYQLGKTLEEISLAARSIRSFANELDRDPSILLRGKPVQGREP